LSVLWFDCDESFTWRGLNSNPEHFVCFTFYLVCLENRICLSRGVQVAGATWCAVTRIMAGVGGLVQGTGDGRTGRILDGQTIERSCDAVCGLHCAREDEKRGFPD
jgi:hypothetical protein